ARAPVPTPVMGDDAIPFPDEIEHLVVPVVGTQRPAMMKYQRLCVLRPPVFEVNLCAVLGCYRAHRVVSFHLSELEVAFARQCSGSKRSKQNLGCLGANCKNDSRL